MGVGMVRGVVGALVCRTRGAHLAGEVRDQASELRRPDLTKRGRRAYEWPGWG